MERKRERKLWFFLKKGYKIKNKINIQVQKFDYNYNMMQGNKIVKSLMSRLRKI